MSRREENNGKLPWTVQVLADCLAECDGDVNAAIAATSLILTAQPEPTQSSLVLSTDAHGREHSDKTGKFITLKRGMSQSAYRKWRTTGSYTSASGTTRADANDATTDIETAKHYASEKQHGDEGVVVEFDAPIDAVRQDPITPEDYRVTKTIPVHNHKVVHGEPWEDNDPRWDNVEDWQREEAGLSLIQPEATFSQSRKRAPTGDPVVLNGKTYKPGEFVPEEEAHEASGQAYDLGHAAIQSGDPKKHAEAAAAHRGASKVRRLAAQHRESSKRVCERHEKMADAHEKSAQKHDQSTKESITEATNNKQHPGGQSILGRMETSRQLLSITGSGDDLKDESRVFVEATKKDSEKTWLDNSDEKTVEATFDLNKEEKSVYFNRIDAIKTGKGYAREVAEHMMKEFSERGYKSMTAYVQFSDQNSQSMMRKLGGIEGKETDSGRYYHFDLTKTSRELSLSVMLAHDVHNRQAQGVLDRALRAARKISATARRDLAAAIAEPPDRVNAAILKFLEVYRGKLASLLTSTQVAAVLEGIREVAAKVPTLAQFPGAIPPPPTLEPSDAVVLVERLERLPVAEQAEAIYKLTPTEQVYVRQAIAARAAPPPAAPPVLPQGGGGDPEDVHFPTIDRAVRHLAERSVMDRQQYDKLDAAARSKAFTVANVSSEETLAKIRDSLARNVREGADYGAWRKKVLADVDAGTFLSDAHQEVVFRSNVQAAFSDGQASLLGHPLVRGGFPYAAYDAIHDDRVRENHLALEELGIGGTNIYRLDDPVFQTFRPPWDYSDRCGWTPLTVRQAARRGVEEAKRWLEAGVEPSPPAHVPMPDFQPPEGFRRAVAASPLSVQLSLQPMAAFAHDVEGQKRDEGGKWTKREATDAAHKLTEEVRKLSDEVPPLLHWMTEVERISKDASNRTKEGLQAWSQHTKVAERHKKLSKSVLDLKQTNNANWANIDKALLDKLHDAHLEAAKAHSRAARLHKANDNSEEDKSGGVLQQLNRMTQAANSASKQLSKLVAEHQANKKRYGFSPNQTLSPAPDIDEADKHSAEAERQALGGFSPTLEHGEVIDAYKRAVDNIKEDTERYREIIRGKQHTNPDSAVAKIVESADDLIKEIRRASEAHEKAYAHHYALDKLENSGDVSRRDPESLPEKLDLNLSIHNVKNEKRDEGGKWTKVNHIAEALPSAEVWKNKLKKLWMKLPTRHKPGHYAGPEKGYRKNSDEDFEDYVREEKLSGLCSYAASVLRTQLAKKGISTRLVGGTYGHHLEHAWLQTEDGSIIDPTECQANDNIPIGEITIYESGTKEAEKYKESEDGGFLTDWGREKGKRPKAGSGRIDNEKRMVYSKPLSIGDLEWVTIGGVSAAFGPNTIYRGKTPPSDNWVRISDGPRGGTRWAKIGSPPAEEHGVGKRHNKVKGGGHGGGRGSDGQGGGRSNGEPQAAGRGVAGAPGGPSIPTVGRPGKGAGKPTGDQAPRGVPRTDIGRVNQRIARYAEVFKKRGNDKLASVMQELRDQIATVGAKAALEVLGEAERGIELPTGVVEPAQGTPAAEIVAKIEATKSASDRAAIIAELPPDQQDYIRRVVISKAHKVQYEGAYDELWYNKVEDQFVRKYLEKTGIVLLQSGSTYDPKIPLVSSFSEKNLAALKREGRVSSGENYVPTDQTLANKLEESKLLPGLETSEDVDTVVGDKVTAFTPEVVAAFDRKYGKGKWLVKSYGAEAYAGFGVVFPQRAKQVQDDAKFTLKDAKDNLKDRGYKLSVDSDGIVNGVIGSGKTYLLGTPEFDALDKVTKRYGKQAQQASFSAGGMRLPMSPEDSIRSNYQTSLLRDAQGSPVGITYWDGRDYKFNTPAYDKIASLEGGTLGADVARAVEADEWRRQGFQTDPKFMVQPAFKAVGVTDADRAAGATWETAKEGRVHVVTRGGKASAIPYATMTGRGDALPAAIRSPDIVEMEKAVEEAIHRLPESERAGQMYAPDVMKTDKGWKVLELNPSAEGGGSDWLGQNPFVIDAFVSHMTGGREPQHVKFIRKLLKDSGVKLKKRPTAAPATPIQTAAQPQPAIKGGAPMSHEDQPREPAGTPSGGRFAGAGRLGGVRTVKYGSMSATYTTHGSSRIPGAKLPLRNYKQRDDHSCGFVAALALARYFTPDVAARDVLRVVRPTRSGGIDARRLTDALARLGVSAEYTDKLTIGKLRKHVADGTPVLITVYPEGWSTDHWTVVQAVSDERVYLTNYKSLSIAEFNREWFDRGEGLVCSRSSKSASLSTEVHADQSEGDRPYWRHTGTKLTKLPSGHHEFTAKNNNKYTLQHHEDSRDGRTSIYAHDHTGEQVAKLKLEKDPDYGGKSYFVDHVRTNGSHRGLGIARAMYDYATEVHGKKIRKSPAHSMSPEGNKLWEHAQPKSKLLSLINELSLTEEDILLAMGLPFPRPKGWYRGGKSTTPPKPGMIVAYVAPNGANWWAFPKNAAVPNTASHAPTYTMTPSAAVAAGYTQNPNHLNIDGSTADPALVTEWHQAGWFWNGTTWVSSKSKKAPKSATGTGGTSAKAPANTPDEKWETGVARPGTLHGIPFGAAPHKFWEKVADVDVNEPKPLKSVDRVGILIQEPDGRVWIVKPTNEFGNRKHTLPGGRVEPGLTDQQNALKETWEETGIQCEITGYVGDFEDSNNKNNGRLYIGKRVGGAPWDAKIESKITNYKTGRAAAESEEVMLVTPERAAKLLHRTDDLAQIMAVSPINLDHPVKGTGSEPLKKFLSGIKPAVEQYKDKKNKLGLKTGNAELSVIQDMRGFNEKPEVLDKTDFDALVAKGKHIELLRGLTDTFTSSYTAKTTAATLADEFRYGDHFPGHGIYGSGTYADSKSGSKNVSSNYSAHGGGAVLRMALPKTANIVKYSDVKDKVKDFPELFDGYLVSGGKVPRDCWRGVQAALAGYDAIYVDKKGASYTNEIGYYVVLNRGVLVVQKEDATGHQIP